MVQMSVLLPAVISTCAVLVAGQDEPAPPHASECATTAAERHGWGEPTRRSDFSDGLPGDWHPYGPEPGHDKQGIRTPEAITVADGVVTISATQDGTTGAMSWHPGQRYGRWEACVRSEAASGGLNALLLLWPVAEDFPVGGEIDWMEILSDDRQETDFFLHYGPDNDQDHGSVQHDSTRWSAYALEWTPTTITAYVNGEEWYANTDTEKFLLGSREIAGTTQLTVYSPEAALGSAIMGAAPGTTVTYQAPNGRDITVDVVAVEPFVP